MLRRASVRSVGSDGDADVSFDDVDDSKLLSYMDEQEGGERTPVASSSAVAPTADFRLNFGSRRVSTISKSLESKSRTSSPTRRPTMAQASSISSSSPTKSSAPLRRQSEAWTLQAANKAMPSPLLRSPRQSTTSVDGPVNNKSSTFTASTKLLEKLRTDNDKLRKSEQSLRNAVVKLKEEIESLHESNDFLTSQVTEIKQSSETQLLLQTETMEEERQQMVDAHYDECMKLKLELVKAQDEYDDKALALQEQINDLKIQNKKLADKFEEEQKAKQELHDEFQDLMKRYEEVKPLKEKLEYAGIKTHSLKSEQRVPVFFEKLEQLKSTHEICLMEKEDPCQSTSRAELNANWVKAKEVCKSIRRQHQQLKQAIEGEIDDFFSQVQSAQKQLQDFLNNPERITAMNSIEALRLKVGHLQTQVKQERKLSFCYKMKTQQTARVLAEREKELRACVDEQRMYIGATDTGRREIIAKWRARTKQ